MQREFVWLIARFRLSLVYTGGRAGWGSRVKRSIRLVISTVSGNIGGCVIRTIIALVYLHYTYVHEQSRLQLTSHLSRSDSHQIRLTRTKQRQQRKLSPGRRLTSSADESGTFDLPPCLAASDAVIRPTLFFFTSSQKAGFPGSFIHSVFSLRRMLFPVVHKIMHRTVETHTHLFQASISSSCRQTSLSSFKHSTISACRRPANGRNTTSFTTHPRSSTALLTTSPWEMLSLKSASGFARPMIRPGGRWGSVTISGSGEGVGNFAPFLLDGTQTSSSDSGSVSLSSSPFVGIGRLATGAEVSGCGRELDASGWDWFDGAIRSR